MKGDKRTVATDALETLGTIIDETAARDAIHIAVEPVIAAYELMPGADVGRLKNGTYGLTKNPVGIVDPFLKQPVRKGQRFWLLVYPRQITSLHHVWTHPAFPETTAEPAFIIPNVSNDFLVADAVKWIENFLANTEGSPSYEAVMSAISCMDEYDDNYLGINEQASGDIPDEFWDHVEIVTGRKFTNRPTYFSCSC